MKILLIDNYDSFTYNLYHYISKLKKNVDVVRNDKINTLTILKKRYDKIVISPGPGNPNQAGNCLKIVKDVHKRIPILGVCLGHQSIGAAYGAKIIKANKIMHGKLSKISHNQSGVFSSIENNFTATRYHSLVIDEDSLSEDFEVSARSDDGTLMAIQHNVLPVTGIQFHPESIATENGKALLKNFLEGK